MCEEEAVLEVILSLKCQLSPSLTRGGHGGERHPTPSMGWRRRHFRLSNSLLSK